jgi:hypothetical protein
MKEEAKLLVTDPVYKWAQTRWPTFNEIAFYMVDNYVPKCDIIIYFLQFVGFLGGRTETSTCPSLSFFLSLVLPVFGRLV